MNSNRKDKAKGRSSQRYVAASAVGLVVNKLLSKLDAKFLPILAKVRTVTVNSHQRVNPQLKPIPIYARSGRRLDNWRRLGQRLQDSQWRRYAYLLLFGKFAAILLLSLVAIPIISHFIGAPVLAADPVLKGNDIVNPLNTFWTLLAAFLVFAMQVGFTMLEAGFCRSRETVNVLMECIVDTCLCGILFYAIGFAFMFSHGNGLIGTNWFFLEGAPATY